MAATSPHPATPMNRAAAWLVIGCLCLVSFAAWAAAAGPATLPPGAGAEPEPEPEWPLIDDARKAARTIRDTPQVRATALQTGGVEDPSLLAGMGFSVLRDIDMRVGDLRLRWVNAATITQVSKNFEWSSTLGAYREFAPQCMLGLELLANGTGTEGTGLGRSDQGVLGRWEQPIYKDWLLGELVAGHFWPRADSRAERGRAWALGGSLKMRF